MVPCVRPAVLAGLALGLTTAAGGYRRVEVASIGFIGPSDTDARPETTACRQFGYQASVGFPYRNRSVVVDLGRPVLVHRLVLVDDFSDHGGTSPTITTHGLELYTSSDNRVYERCTRPFAITARKGTAEGAHDVVEINGLALFARFIKLHRTLPDDKWDFANNNLQHMVRAYQDLSLAGDITSIVVPRYAAGRGLLEARIRLPAAAGQGLQLQIADESGRTVGQLPIPPDGLCKGHVDVSRLSPGLHRFRARIVTPDGPPVAEAHVDAFVCREVLENPARTWHAEPAGVVLVNGLARGAPAAWRRTTFTRRGETAARALLEAESGAPALTVPLPATGWCAVSIGMLGDSEAEARLGDSGEWRRCRLEVWREHDEPRGLGESLAACADLDRTTLHIRPRGESVCRIAFVRLLGLTDADVQLVRAARRPNEAKRVIVNNDGYSMFFGGVNSVEQIHRMIDRYAGRALYSYDYCLGTDSSCTYDTKVGTVFGTATETFWRQGDRRAFEAVRKLIAEGNDPLRVVIDRCRRQGLRVNTSFRMNACYRLPTGKTFNGAHYWRLHDSCRIMTRHGKPHPNLSYAYADVRAYRLAIIREAAAYGPDGMHLDFLRHPPFTGNDPPINERYERVHGEPPPADPFGHERWEAVRREVMTGFVRDVRRALDDVGETLGRRLPLSASFDCIHYREQGLDVDGWVAAGLLDQISPGVHGMGGTHFGIAEFARMTRGKPCGLFVRLEHTIHGHDPTPESERGEVTFTSEHMTLNLYRRRVLELYGQGADGVYLFNTGGIGLVDPLSDKPGLRAWDAVQRPLVGWFDPVD